MARNWTTGQQQAIDARGGNLLVSAAAGSGKTAVLVERVIRRLSDPQSPVSADRLLIVTFTRAAAGEIPAAARVLQEVPGKGVIAEVEGRRVLAGSAGLLAQEGVATPNVRADGTCVLVAVDGVYAGMIRLADTYGEEHISGQIIHRRGEDALPKFISSSLDLPFAVSYFQYNHNTDPGMEKKAILLIDKIFALDLHGIYSRNHALIFSGAGLMELQDGDDPAILGSKI